MFSVHVSICVGMFNNVEVGLAMTWEHQPGDHLRQAFKHQCSINKSPTLRASTTATFFMEVAGSVENETPLGQSTSCSWQGFPRGRCGLIQSATKKARSSRLWCRRGCGCGCGAEEEDALTITKLCSLLSPTRWQESQPGIPKCDWHWWHQPQMSRVHTPGPHQSPNLQHHQDKDQSPKSQTSPKSK